MGNWYFTERGNNIGKGGWESMHGGGGGGGSDGDRSSNSISSSSSGGGSSSHASPQQTLWPLWQLTPYSSTPSSDSLPVGSSSGSSSSSKSSGGGGGSGRDVRKAKHSTLGP